MFCRRACQRLAPLARRAFTPTSTKAPARHMSFGIPGGSTNMTYVVLCGGGLTAAVVYAYKSVTGDSNKPADKAAAPSAEAVAEAVAAPAEPAPVEEAAPVSESVAAPAEAPAEESVAEAAAEPVTEVISAEEVAPASEEVVAEAAAEPAVTEEAAPPVAEEPTPEAAPVAVEAVAVEEAPAEAPAAESAESPPELMTVKIAAASVGETSIVNTVRYVQGDGKAPGAVESIVGVLEPDVPEATKEEEAVRAEAVEDADVANEEEPKSTAAPAVAADTLIQEVADTTDAEASSTAEEKITEKIPVPAAVEQQEEEAAPPSEDTTVAAPVVEEVDDDGDAPADKAPDAETSVEEALVEALEEPAAAEEAIEAVPAPDEVVDTTQTTAASPGSDPNVLSAAEPESTSEAPLEEAKHCHSCHSATTSKEEVAPPAALGEEVQVEVQVVSDRAVDVTEEATETQCHQDNSHRCLTGL